MILMTLLKPNNRPRKWRGFWVGIFMICAIAAPITITATAQAQRVDESVMLVDALVAAIQDLTENHNSTQDAYAKTDAIINQFFDYESIARFCVGPYWRKASAEQRAQYLAAFRKVLIAQTINNLDNFNSIEYRHQSANAKGKEWVIVNGIIIDKTATNPQVAVAWRIRDKEGEPLYIFDLSIENVSMLITQRDENTAIIRQNAGDLDALIARLNEQSQTINTDN